MPSSRIEGVDELIAELDNLTLTQGKQILSKSLRRGLLLLAEEAEHLAPVLTGRLAANIVTAVQEHTATEAIGRYGPAQTAFYGLFPEFGTAHMIPEPFLEPSFENKIDEAEAVIRFDLDQLILKAIGQ